MIIKTVDNLNSQQTIQTFSPNKKSLLDKIKAIQTKYYLFGIGVIAIISAAISGVILVSSDQELQVPKITYENTEKQELAAVLTAAPTIVAEQKAINAEVAAALSKTPTPTASPSATANWPTFSSQKYGYSFQFPPTWTAVRTAQSDPLTLDYVVLNPSGLASGSAITFSYSARTPAQALAIYPQQGIPITVNGVAATEKNLQNSAGVTSIQVVIPDGSNSVIWYAGTAYQNVLNSILGTFQLL